MASQTWPPFSPRLIILLYNPNGGSGVPPIFYRGPRGPSPAVAGSPPARRRVPTACGGVPPIICRGPRGPLPTIGGSPQGPRCMWWGSPHQGPHWACQEKTLPSLIRLGSISPDASPAQYIYTYIHIHIYTTYKHNDKH